MRVGLVQAAFPAGQLAENYKIITAFARQAQAAGVELLCFPELALTGYCRTTAPTLDFTAVGRYLGVPEGQAAAGKKDGAESAGDLRRLSEQLKITLVVGAVRSKPLYSFLASSRQQMLTPLLPTLP